MKLQVFLRSFGAPILLAILLVIRLSIGLTPFRALAETVFVLSITFSRLLSDDRYLQNITIRNGRLQITYYTRFLQLKTAEFALSDLSDVKLSRRLSIAAIWSPVLELKTNDEWTGFYIISKELYGKVAGYNWQVAR